MFPWGTNNGFIRAYGDFNQFLLIAKQAYFKTECQR